MSKYHCYLCASDEGILLDIFGDAGKAFRENIETCLLVKIKPSDVPSTKICHKCAYELDSCEKFLHKYWQSRDSKDKGTSKRGHCDLCNGTRKKVRLLEIERGNSLKNSLRKIQELFNDNFINDKSENLSICLDCRYNLDVLFDLRNIYQETPNKLKSVYNNGINISDLPKTKTSVVNRKTTYIPLPKLNGNLDYNSDTSTSSTMSLKRKRGRPRKDSAETPMQQYRTCEECSTHVERGIDMYRYHRTGLIVCKDCWLTMDPEKMSNGKRKKIARADPDSSTKLCAVFLKDVLSNPFKYKNIYKVEKDKHGNTTFLITDESSENEDKDKTPPKRLRGRASTSSITSLETTIKIKKPIKKLAIASKNGKDSEAPEKVKSPVRTNESESSIVKPRTRNGIDTESTVRQTRTRSRTVELNTEPEISVKTAPVAEINSGKRLGRTTKSSVAKNISSDDTSPAAKSSGNKTRALRTRRGRKPGKSTSDISELDKPQIPMKKTRSNSFTSQETMPLTTRLDTLSDDSKSSGDSKITESTTKTSRTFSKNTTYTCSACGVGYKNKLIGKAHELTHEKQPEVKLQRIAIPETIAEEISVEISLVEEPEEQTHDVSSTSNNNSENTFVDVAIDNESTILIPETTENKENSGETVKSPSPEETKIDEKENNENNEIKETEKTTEIPLINETPDVNSKIEINQDEKIHENENGENDDDNENKENNDNENKENDVKENTESDENENRENDGNENKENDENENRNDNNTEMLRNVEESSIVTESCVDKNEEETREIDQTEKPDSTVCNDIEKESENIESPEESHEDNIESRKKEVNGDELDNVETVTEIDEAENIEKGTDVNIEKSSKNVVTKILEESKESNDKVSSTMAELAEPKDLRNENEVKNEEETVDSSEEIADNQLLRYHEDDEEIKSLEEKEVKKRRNLLRNNEDENEEKSPRSKANRDDEISLRKEEDKEENESPENKNEEQSSTKIVVANESAETTESSEETHPVSVVTEILREVFDLASAEVKKRLEKNNPNDVECATPETLENISLEIQNSADMPSLEHEEQTSNDKS